MSESLPRYWAYSLKGSSPGSPSVQSPSTQGSSTKGFSTQGKLQLAKMPSAVRSCVLTLIWQEEPIVDGPLLLAYEDATPEGDLLKGEILEDSTSKDIRPKKNTSKDPAPKKNASKDSVDDPHHTPVLIAIEQGAFTSPYQLRAYPQTPSPGQRQWLHLTLPDKPAIDGLTIVPTSAWFAFLKLTSINQEVANYPGLFEVAKNARAPSIGRLPADLDYWPPLAASAVQTLAPIPSQLGLRIDYQQDSVQHAIAKLEERLQYRSEEREQLLSALAATQQQLTGLEQRLEVQAKTQTQSFERLNTQQQAFSQALLDLQDSILDQTLTELAKLQASSKSSS